MTTHRRTLQAIGLLAIFTVCDASMSGQAGEFKRIRPQSPILRTVIAAALERSATFRELVNRIEHSDVIVHLTCEEWTSAQLLGRTLITSAGPDARYLRIQIQCRQHLQLLVGIVGHELQHAVEIASAPNVVDDESFRRLFIRIGYSGCLSARGEQFETSAALETGERVREEFVRATVPRPLPADRPMLADRATTVDRKSH